eukprot:SAG31_NODE_3270_length_4477_cov_2.498401_4_plen_136_part_00
MLVGAARHVARIHPIEVSLQFADRWASSRLKQVPWGGERLELRTGRIPFESIWTSNALPPLLVLLLLVVVVQGVRTWSSGNHSTEASAEEFPGGVGNTVPFGKSSSFSCPPAGAGAGAGPVNGLKLYGWCCSVAV